MNLAIDLDRVRVTAAEGAYCPIPEPHVLAKRLALRICVFTAIGLEMRCMKCKEYWPADTEFYFPQRNQPGGLHRYCKDCYLISQGRSAGVPRVRNMQRANADLRAGAGEHHAGTGPN